MMASAEATRAIEWLAAAAPDPQACRWEWERSVLGVVMLPAGRLWDVLILPDALGRLTLDVMLKGSGRPGPVLADFGENRVGFLVPVGTAGRWVGTGVRAVGEGTWIVVPHPARPARAGRGPRWLLPPDGGGHLSDPVMLELAMHEAAAMMAGGSAGDEM